MAGNQERWGETSCMSTDSGQRPSPSLNGEIERLMREANVPPPEGPNPGATRAGANAGRIAERAKNAAPSEARHGRRQFHRQTFRI